MSVRKSVLGSNPPPPSFTFAPESDSRRHSAAPFSLTAILNVVESPKFPNEASSSDADIAHIQAIRDVRTETILHRMGRKISALLPGHDRNMNAASLSLRIPMQTEVQVVRESNSDDGKDSWTGNDVYAHGPSMSFLSTSSSLANRRVKRKPAPIHVPNSSFEAVEAYIEQILPNGEAHQANKYSSHTMRSRSYSIPSATSNQSSPCSPLRPSPLRQASQPGQVPRSIKLPPPVPPRSPQRLSPSIKQMNFHSSRVVHINHVRNQSLSTVVKALFGVGSTGRLQSKKAAVLVSRTSSLKRMKSKASISSSPTKARFKTHYTKARSSRDKLAAMESEEMNKAKSLRNITIPAKRERKYTLKRRKEAPSSFLPITPHSSR